MARVVKEALGWCKYEGMEGAMSFTLNNKLNNETTFTNVAPKLTFDFCLMPLVAAFSFKRGE